MRIKAHEAAKLWYNSTIKIKKEPKYDYNKNL